MSARNRRERTARPRLTVEGLEDRTAPAAGSLDGTFGTGGKAVIPFSTGIDFLSDVVLLDTQKILVAGAHFDAAGRSDFLVARLTASGQPDTDPATGFGPHTGGAGSPRAGFVTLDLGSNTEEWANALAIDHLGRIVVGGHTRLGSLALALARLNPDGSLDGTFGTAGKVVTDVSAGHDALLDLAVLADGRVVGVGYANNFGVPTSDFVTVMYSATGRLEPGNGWVAVHDFGDRHHDVAYSVAVQGDGKILVGGGSSRFFPGTSRSNTDLGMLRYEQSGVLDPVFANGKTNLAPGNVFFESSNERVTDLAVLPDGRIAVAGVVAFDSFSGPHLPDDLLAAVFTPSGTLDGAFDFDGWRSIDFGGNADSAEGLAVQPDGKLIIAGASANGAGQADAVVVRLTAAGGLDSTFDADGTVTTDLGTTGDVLRAVVVQADSRIVVAGQAGGDSAVVRYEGDEVRPPTADAGGPYTALEGSEVELDGSRSAAGTPIAAPASYEWDLDYDGATFQTDATGSRPRVRFGDNFPARTIALRVTDASGRSAIATTTLEVHNAPPVLQPAPGYTGNTGDPIPGIGLAFVDPGTGDTHAATVDWGDDSGGPVTVIPGDTHRAVGSHTYSRPGTYTAVFTVTDDDGDSTITSLRIDIFAKRTQVVLDFSGTSLSRGALEAGGWFLPWMYDIDGRQIDLGSQTPIGWAEPGPLEVPAFATLFTPDAPGWMDFDGNATVDLRDALAATDEILAKVRQDLSPYNADVAVRSGGTAVFDDLDGDNNRAAYRDAVVFVGNLNPSESVLGLAPRIDVGNSYDDLVFTYAGRAFASAAALSLAAATQRAFFVNVIAQNASHEAGHAFGLDHAVSGGEPARHEIMYSDPIDGDGGHDFAFLDLSFTGQHTQRPQNAHRYLASPSILGPSSRPWAAVLRPGTLTVTGDEGDNQLAVRLTGTSDWWTVDVDGAGIHLDPDIDPGVVDLRSLNPFDAAVSRIVVEGRGGNDTIVVDPAITASLEASGGAGNDLIRGGAGDDALDGGNGFDTLDGRGGGDSYRVRFGGLPSVTAVQDTGLTGADSLWVGGTDGGDTLLVTADRVVRQGEPVQEVTFAGVEALTIDAGGGDDVVVVDGSQTTILGGEGDDTFVVLAAGAHGLLLDGQGGSDTYRIGLGHLGSGVTVADSGGPGAAIDAVTVIGTPGDDILELSEGRVALGSQTVTYTSSVERLVVDGAGGTNRVTVGGTLTVPTVWRNAAGVGVAGGVLLVVGTAGNDRVHVNEQGNGRIKVDATFLPGGSAIFPTAWVERIHVVLGDGHDQATVSGGTTKAVILDGGGGADALVAGGGPSILLGGGGSDVLVGGRSRNILIGGLGADVLIGGGGDDVLIGGTTVYDGNPDALSALLGVWVGEDGYADRVRRLRDANKPVFLQRGATVLDDNAPDLLLGSGGSNWFFFDPGKDVLVGRRPNEAIN